MDKYIFKENNLFRGSILGRWFYINTLCILLVGVYYNIDNRGVLLHIVLIVLANHILFGIYYTGNTHYHNIQDGCNSKYVTNKVHGRKQGLLCPNTILLMNLIAFVWILLILIIFNFGLINNVFSIIAIVIISISIVGVSLNQNCIYSAKHKEIVYGTISLQVIAASIGIIYLPVIVSTILHCSTAFIILLLGKATRYV